MPIITERTTATSRIIIRTLLNCPASNTQGEIFFSSLSSLNPCSARRRFASSSAKPSGPEPNDSRVSDTLRLYHFFSSIGQNDLSDADLFRGISEELHDKQ